MKNYVDLHTHILPGLDDGPTEVEESLRILVGLEKLGFSTVFATPHHRLDSWEGLDPDAVERAAEDLRGLSTSCGLQLKLHTGMEFDLDETLPDRSLLRPGKIGPLLVDIGFWSVPRELEGLLSLLPGDVCLVHPERNDELCRDTERLKNLVAGGIKLLGNLGSLSGLYGERVNRRSRELLEEELYWAFASDLHSVEQLDWISEGIDNLGAMAGQEAVRRLLSHNPMKAVKNLMASQKVINAPRVGRPNQ
jgi:protein-tyrosine phosphatase